MKSFKGTKKLELNLNIEFGRAVLSTISVSRRSEVMHAQKVGIEVIPFYLVIKSQLKKSSYKGVTKIVPSRFSSRPACHINSPLEKSVKAGKLPVEP